MYIKWGNKPHQPNNTMPKTKKERTFVEEINIDLL